MKLNKMLALALSGVMAVSMLAGCNGATSDGDEGSSSSQGTVATGVVAAMNDVHKYVEFTDKVELNSALSAAAAKVSFGDIDNAGYTVSNSVSSGDKVYDELNKKLPYGELGGNVIFNSDKAGIGGSKTKTALYLVEADGLTAEQAAKQVAKSMNQDSYYPDVVTISNDTYEATYTGAVSVVKVSQTDGGKTESAYYIAVSVTQNISRDTVEVSSST